MFMRVAKCVDEERPPLTRQRVGRPLDCRAQIATQAVTFNREHVPGQGSFCGGHQYLPVRQARLHVSEQMAGLMLLL